MKIGLACDHAGFKYKEKLKKYLYNKGYNFIDYGCNSEESVDYPDFGHKLANSIENNENNIGIQFCGTGNGINMSANKHQGIRSALCWNTHIAEQSRKHNNANVLCLGANNISQDLSVSIVNSFLSASFLNEENYVRRVNKFKK